MLMAGFLFVFLHTGFSMREAGCVRHRDPQVVLAKNLTVVALVFLCWWGWGYAFAFGTPPTPNKFIGGAHFFMAGLRRENFRAWFFQGALCSTAVSIAGGAMAERTTLRGYLMYSFLMSSLIYPVVVYWGWSGQGILSYSSTSTSSFLASALDPTLMDIAGSGVVHLAGGIGALVGAAAVGPRRDRFNSPVPEEFQLGSTPFCVSGMLFLLFGWFGLNAGSMPSMHSRADAHRAGLIACNTIIAACVGGLLVASFRSFRPRTLNAAGLCNGMLAGLVSISAGCGMVEPWEAAVIGVVGGLAYLGASALVLVVKIDDAVDAFAVHGACGLWGILSLGFFGDPSTGFGGNGMLYGGNQLWTQVLAGVLISVWVSLLSALVFVPLRLFGVLRMEQQETLGVERTDSFPSMNKVHSEEFDQVISVAL